MDRGVPNDNEKERWPEAKPIRHPMQRIHRNTIHLGRIFSIEIGLDWSWFIVFFLITWMLSTHYLPSNYAGWSLGLYWIVGIATSLLFFGSVMAHELSHGFVARSLGTPVRSITLFVFGGAAELSEEPKRPRDELWMSLAGPGMSLILAALFGLAWLATQEVAQPVAASLFWLGWINLMLAGFNLIPGFPLDGGRVLRSIVWSATGDLQRATRVASFAGKAVGYLFMVGGFLLAFQGFLLNGVWIALIGWFLVSAAANSYRQILLRDGLAGHTAQEVMMVDCPPVSVDLTIDKVVEEYVLRSGRRCFPVADTSGVSGYITLETIKGIPRQDWATTTVNQIKLPFDQGTSVTPQMTLSAVLKLLSGEATRQLPVLEGSRYVGMINRENVFALVRARGELGI